MYTKGIRPSLCVPQGAGSELALCARAQGWEVREVEGSKPDADRDMSVAVFALGTRPVPNVDALRQRFRHALFVSEGDRGESADIGLPARADRAQLRQLLQHARAYWQQNLKLLQLHQEIGSARYEIFQLNSIGIALSTQMDSEKLLATILTEARKLASCEAGSLYLIDRGSRTADPALVFKLTQNDVVDCPFVERRLPLTTDSVAGYVAMTGQEQNLVDVYDLPEDTPYQFNPSFDQQMGYRTRSMLVLPMRDHRQRVVGVLQFINHCKPGGGIGGFEQDLTQILRGVASQAAISIQKNTLVEDINQLFEGFVQASVKAIEQRDPTTSGHSARVASSTVALLEALPRSNLARFRTLSLSEEHLREVRYAALLHDFGKVGVPENILLKANKLTDERLEILRYRVELQKERARRRMAERERDLLHHGVMDIEVARRRARRDMARELSVLDQYFEAIVAANRPNLLSDGDFRHLQEIRNFAFRDFDGTLNGLITDDDMLALSIRRGSLTPSERQEIQAHVVHTREFLAVLPWPEELADVPAIAGAHHEKMDGSGYPEGLVGEEIPLASRVMTVCDIYDALTAMDRPYKDPITPERALDIISEEARAGMLDRDVTQVFIDSRCYEQVWPNASRAAV